MSKPNNYKDTNPKDAVGIKKVPFSVLSSPVLAEMALGMLEGARKYGRHNYREDGARASTYYDAFNRHVKSWWEGEDIDPDSGIHHLSKAADCLMVVRDAQIMGKDIDDRPPKAPAEWLRELNKVAAKIIERYPNVVRPYTELNRKRSK
jgi:hypothetical protein